MPICSSYAQTIGQDRLPGRGQSIKLYKMSGEIQAALDNAGFDLFYVMTGEYRSDNYELMLEAFDYAIQELPPDEQGDIRILIEPVYETLVKATNAGKRSTHH
ncbi:hypothetical protein AXA91_12510 [Salmonella enterica]|nr:hypothetical protein [Salmonella enterica]